MTPLAQYSTISLRSVSASGPYFSTRSTLVMYVAGSARLGCMAQAFQTRQVIELIGAWRVAQMASPVPSLVLRERLEDTRSEL